MIAVFSVDRNDTDYATVCFDALERTHKNNYMIKFVSFFHSGDVILDTLAGESSTS